MVQRGPNWRSSSILYAGLALLALAMFSPAALTAERMVLGENFTATW